MIVFYLGSDSNQNAALDQETGPIFDSKIMKCGISTALKYCFTSGIFQMRNLAADKPSAAEIGWISLKWYRPIKNHLLLIVLVSSDLFCHGNDILTFGRSCCEPWGCQTLSPRPCCTGHRKEAQSSQGDYFFNKRKHWEGKCLKEVVIQREMTKWLLWLETKQISTATFFISVRNAVRGREVNCVEAKENRNQRWREKEG